MAYRPTEKTEARKKAQRSLLLNTSLSIVAEQGFKGLTVAVLAEKANVAIGTVYKYFDSKAVLCQAVFRLGTEKEVEKVRQAAFPESGGVSCHRRLEDAIRIFSSRAIAGRRLAYALIAEPVDSLVQEERLKYRKAYGEIFEQVIREGIDSGEFTAQDTRVSAAALVGLLAEILLGSIGDAMATNQEIEPEYLIDQIVMFSLRAVGTKHTS